MIKFNRTVGVVLLSLYVGGLLSRGLAAQGINQTANTSQSADSCLVYTGSYSDPAAEGIQVFRLNLATGALTKVGGAAGVTNPSFLAIHPSKKFLYAVGETKEFSGKPTGAVAAFALDDAGLPTLLNQVSSEGQGPCHISLDKLGKHALVANYDSGHVAVLPIGDDGKLAPASSTVLHQGKSVNPNRQAGPHAHSMNLDAANNFALAADLGIDKILVYKFDKAAGKITPNDPPAVDVPPGSGPRHFAFHPSGKYAYANGEMTSTVIAFAYDADKGALKQLQVLSTLPEAMPRNSTAETLVSPDGKYVYVSNRGHDSLAVFAVDEATGMLRAVGNRPTGGRTPRNFNIDPTGKWLLAAHQNSGNVVVFKIDPATGLPAPTGDEVAVPRAVCVKFLVK